MIQKIKFLLKAAIVTAVISLALAACQKDKITEEPEAPANPANPTNPQQQRKVLVEQFTSSACPPCATMNAWLNTLLKNNAEKVVVVKYPMDFPGTGDPYYTAEGGLRKTYYNISGVPSPFINGVFSNTEAAIRSAIDAGYAQAPEADISGTFKVEGNNITVSGNVTPLVSGSGYKVYVVVNEKATSNNTGSNGETEFVHVMMKILPDGNGNAVTLTAGVAIPFNYTHNMSSTNVEEMNDLEVAVFVQHESTKAILNAAYLNKI